MEELIACLPDDGCLVVLKIFCEAHYIGLYATGSNDHARSYVELMQRWIQLLGKLQRFRDQGEAMCSLSNVLYTSSLDRKSEAATWYQRARDVGAAHGFFSVESTACMGLGTTAMEEGRLEEGIELLRNALVAAELNELDNPNYELAALNSLINALLSINSNRRGGAAGAAQSRGGQGAVGKGGLLPLGVGQPSLLCSPPRGLVHAPRVRKLLTTALFLLSARPYSV